MGPLAPLLLLSLAAYLIKPIGPFQGRDPEYLKIQELWTVKVGAVANLLAITPNWLKPFVSFFLSFSEPNGRLSL
jgi:hypothetical protein